MKSISFRLIAVVLLICALGMGLIAASSTVLAGRSLLEQSLGRVVENTNKESQRINGWLENQTSYIAAIAQDMANMPESTPEERVALFAAHAAANDQYSEVYIGYPDGTGDFSSGWLPDYAGGWASYKRGWYIGAAGQPGHPYLTAPYTDSISGNLCIAASMAVLKKGQVTGVVAADMYIDVLQEIVGATNVGEGSFAFLTDADGAILIHPNQAYRPGADDSFQNLTEIEQGSYAELWDLTAQDGETVVIRDPDGISRYYTTQTIPATGWKLYTAIPAGVIQAPIYRQAVVALVVFGVILLLAAFLLYLMTKRIVVKPIQKVTQAAQQLADGNTDVNLEQDYLGEIGQLAASFTHMAKIRREQVEATERIASGDLSAGVPVQSAADVMGKALWSLQDSLRKMVGQIYEASLNVSAGAGQITNNTQLQAQNATGQAASIQQLSVAIRQIAEQIQTSEGKASETGEVSRAITTDAQKGIERMERMVAAVNEINDASTSISKVIKAIDDIAFQTNILALNAAVEAARAGQHGKGFAVVAEEVRNLAAKSAKAANETTALIENSIAKASEGTRIAYQTNESLHTVIAGIEKSVNLIDEISAAARQQSSFITEISESIEQVSRAVDLGAANSEESAAAAVELATEAKRLTTIVEGFQMENGENAQLWEEEPTQKLLAE